MQRHGKNPHADGSNSSVLANGLLFQILAFQKSFPRSCIGRLRTNSDTTSYNDFKLSVATFSILKYMHTYTLLVLWHLGQLKRGLQIYTWYLFHPHSTALANFFRNCLGVIFPTIFFLSHVHTPIWAKNTLQYHSLICGEICLGALLIGDVERLPPETGGVGSMH